jgi:hypothetical protein
MAGPGGTQGSGIQSSPLKNQIVKPYYKDLDPIKPESSITLNIDTINPPDIPAE